MQTSTDSTKFLERISPSVMEMCFGTVKSVRTAESHHVIGTGAEYLLVV